MADMMEVKRIALGWNGITHIVQSEYSGYVFTLCDSMISGESMTTWPLKPRVCRACRKRLKRAKLVAATEQPK